MAGQILKGDGLYDHFHAGKRAKLKGNRQNLRRRFKGAGTSTPAPTPGPMTGGAPIITEGLTQGTMW